MSIHQLPQLERPRERLTHFGSDALSTAELLAILLGSGTIGKSVLELAQELLAHFGSLEAVADASVAELTELKGLGEAKAITLQAAFALARRLQRPDPKIRITSPEHAYNLVHSDLAHCKEERMLVLLQDAKGYIIRKELVAVGTLTQVLAHPREVFYPAVRHKAAAILLAHNHPTGDPTPSKEDLALTRTLQSAGLALHIPLSDHLIIGSESFTSLRDYLGELWKTPLGPNWVQV